MSTAAVACSSSSGKAVAPSTTTVPAKHGPVSFTLGARYVALGSSYAAGVGIPNQLDACGRSDHNYPHLVAQTLHLDLVDVSCDGATTANVVDTPQGKNPPQGEAVTRDTALITMTVGGNDVGYIAKALECGQANPTTCSADPAAVDAAFAMLRGALPSLIQMLRARAPAATIVLVTYARLVPPAPCPALDYSRSASALVGSIGARLEQTFLDVVQKTGVRLADPYALGADHGPCAPATTRWVDGHNAPGAYPYHPTALGHEEMASLVQAALSR